MPSSLIFAGLVVIWLLILVPAVARRRQEVARPSMAALSGRVLERPRQRRRTQEVDVVDEADGARPVTTQPGRERPEPDRRDDGVRVPAARAPGARELDDGRWERPPPRYRPGRGGFDPEAAALAARARYAFRQRVVLALLVGAVVTAVVAVVVLPGLWWPHAAVDVALVGYLAHLRRQVRMEEAIRERRAARMAGTRRPSAAEDPELDESAQRGREATRRPVDDRRAPVEADIEDVPADEAEPAPALPRLQPAPPPPLPAGTALVEVDDDPDLHQLDGPPRPDYRRVAGE